MKKRLLAFLLVFMMLVQLLPVSVLAANQSEDESGTEPTQQAEETTAEESEEPKESEEPEKPEESEEIEKTRAVEEPIAYPAQEFNGSASPVFVYAEVEEGVFPAGTRMLVRAVSAAEVLSQANDLDESAIAGLVAVDISFVDEGGRELQPAGDGVVQLSLYSLTAVEGEEHEILHLDEDGNTESLGEAGEHGGSVEADSFSIYIIVGTDPGTTGDPVTGRVTYVFMANGEEISRQILKNGETLYRPEAPVVAHKKFVAWIDGSNNAFTNFGAQTVGESDTTVTLTASYEPCYTVTFHNTLGGEDLIAETVEGTNGDVIATTSDDVSLNVPAGKALAGWSTESNGTPLASVTIDGADLDLYPVLIDAVYLFFDSNANNGDPTPASETKPAYTLNGASAAEPEEPSRVGYCFGGWYEDADCTSAYDFATTLTADKTVYAKWIPEEVEYTVFVEREVLEDDGTYTAGNYEVAASLTLQAEAGTRLTEALVAALVPAEIADELTYHEVDPASSAATGIVRGDGATIARLCYRLKVYTIDFDPVDPNAYSSRDFFVVVGGSDAGASKEHYQIQGRVGELIADAWPDGCRQEEYGEPTSAMFYQWNGLAIAQATKVFNVSEEMGDIGNANGGTVALVAMYDYNLHEREVEYWLEDPDAPGTYAEATQYGQIYYRRTRDFLYAKALTGFSCINNPAQGNYNRDVVETNAPAGYPKAEGKYILGSGANPTEIPYEGSAESTVIFYTTYRYYYDRDEVTLSFYNYNTIENEHTQTAKTEQLIDPDWLYEPAKPAALAGNWSFDGWYTEEELLNRFTVSAGESRMPKHNLVLYARWVPEGVTLNFVLNGGDAADGTDAATEYAEQSVPIDHTGVQPTNPVRDGYDFIGWFTEDGDRFNFETPLSTDTVIYARWHSQYPIGVIYDAGEHGSNPPEDDAFYDDYSHARALGMPGSIDEGWQFTGWKLVQEREAGDIYQPNEVFEVNAAFAEPLDPATTGKIGAIRLVAQYEPDQPNATVIYHSNVPGADATVSETVTNNGEITIKTLAETGFSYPGHSFVGWGRSSEAGTAAVYDGGETGRFIDGENHLYAIWTAAEQTPGLAITKATTSTPANGAKYVEGETIEYKLTVTNTGNVDLADVVVADELTGLSKTVASLAAGESKEFTTSYVVTAADAAAGTVENTATVSAPDPTAPGETLTDSATAEDPRNPGETLTFSAAVEDPTKRFDPCYVDPPVKKIVNGKPEKDETFRFTLTLESMPDGLETLPMPAGAKGKTKTIEIVGSGEKEFGKIELSVEGTYVYKISEENTGATGYTYDTGVYTLTVVVTREGDHFTAKETVTRDGKASEAITFTNAYSAGVKTGDEANIALWSAMALGSMLSLAAAWFLSRKKARAVK